MAIFRPKKILNRFTELDIDELAQNGIEVILIDVDNTITLPDIGGLTDEAKAFLDRIKSSKVKPIIFSNAKRSRVVRLIKNYDIEYNFLVMKPFPFAFWFVCLKKGLKPRQVAAIGDQLMTDILGANLSGCYSIYSKPITSKDTFLTSINRFFERIIWRILNEKM